ncbi:MAG: response regulator [Ruminococcus sp.]|jgi:CheY-like chemotaxis protein/nitrogen-specific signal transduction histidine kinase/GGDEF domain-containing protein|nr:response regulator [Ruminococcus sp.]
MQKKKISLSLYTSVIIPIMLGLIFMIIAVCVLLWTNGTMETLVKSSLNILSATTENAALKLETDMTRNFSNIGGLESDIADIVAEYMEETGITAEELSADPDAYAPIDEKLADAILGAIRFSNASGIFVVFSDGNEDEVFLNEAGEYSLPTDGVRTLHCVHFRDLDPLNNPADFSDIIIERGSNDVALAKNIPADSFWRPDISLTPENVASFDFYYKPFKTAKENPMLPPETYGYWGKPRVLSNISGPETRDTYTYITYSMPIIVGGEVIGVVGSEVQVNYIRGQYLPASDFEAIGAGGYLLAKYDEFEIDPATPRFNDAVTSEKMVVVTPYIVSGETAETEFTAFTPIEILLDVYNPWHMTDESIYAFNRGHEESSAHMSLYPLKLYDDNSPFANERWAVVGESPNSLLFATSDNLWADVTAVSAICLFVALLFTIIIVWFAIRPLKTLTAEVKAAAGEIPEPRVYDVKEIEVLRGALNDSYNKARRDRQTLSDEQERFKLALSLATGTLLEYNPETDITKITRFDTDTTPFIWTLEHTLERLKTDRIIHPEDAASVITLFCGKPLLPFVARVNMRILPKAFYKDDTEYAWLRFSCKIFTNEKGEFIRLIGTTQDVTAEEYKRERDLIRLRTDPTTQLYNREYGFSMFAAALAKTPADMMLAQISLEPALICEAYYGLFYTNVIHYGVARRLQYFLPAGTILARGGDNDIFALLPASEKEHFAKILSEITALADVMYVGENEDIKLSITVGAALSGEALNVYELSARTNAAIKYALENSPGSYLFYRDLPGNVRTPITYTPTPITFNSDIAAMSITAIAFNLFERTKDTSSVINMLLMLVAKRFRLSRVFIVENEMDFLTNIISYCYTHNGFPEVTDRVSRVPREYYSDFDSFAHGDGMHIVTSNDNASDSIKTLLRVKNLDKYSVFACGMYVNGELSGKIVFTHADPAYKWSEDLTNDLNEVTKIITSHLSRSKSDTASKAKTEFLSKISHEIRTPMNAIIGLSDIARKAEAEGNTERTVDCLKKIDGSAKFLLTIINDVLDMSKIESGKVTLSNEPVDIVTAVTDVADMIRPMVESRGMDFITDIDVKNGYVFCDAPRLKQVLTNLLGNAVKFTEAGFISLTVKERADGYYFAVTDTGKGISEENKSRVFDSFVQLDSSEKVYGGTGLGLSISSRIVKLMGGTIELTSEPEKGSSFFFTIPLDAAERETETTEELIDKDYSGYFKGKRALLVEDNELNTEIAVSLLEDAGLEVITAENGEIGANAYDEKPAGYFDVIFMDIRMPVLDGLGATKLIRQNSTHSDAANIPIIAMTANAFDEDMKKSMEAGMSGYLPKPIDINRLYKMLDETITEDSGEKTEDRVTTDDSGQFI